MADNTWAVLRWSARSLTQGTPNGRFSRLPGFGIYTRRMSGARYPWPVNGSKHWLHPFPEGLLCLSHGLAVHSWSRALRNLTQIRPYSFSCDVMGQGSEPYFWFTSCFRCYSFESCFHGWFIFSLHRSPDLSLDRAHVSHEQFIFCWPLPHVAGSPDRGVLSASLTSTRPSDLPRLVSLSGPTGFRLNLMDLPCSHEILWLHAGGTNPGSLPDAHRVVPGNTAFPIER